MITPQFSAVIAMALEKGSGFSNFSYTQQKDKDVLH